jgi:agmatinase
MGFSPLRFLGAVGNTGDTKALIAGFPYDRTASHRAGSRFGPNALRIASDSIESYDPALEMDLEDLGPYTDLGDLEIGIAVPDKAVDVIRGGLNSLPDLPILGLGGEHTLTPLLVEHALKRHPDLVFVVLDAHADLRPEYEGTRWSHACAAHRVMDLVGPERIAMLGVRSGTQDEFRTIRAHDLLFPPTEEGLTRLNEWIGDSPVYLSVDLDGLDPSFVPGTGTTEPGGLSWSFFIELSFMLRPHEIVGADVVELAPDLDPEGGSAIVAARVARSLLIMILG